MQNEIEYLHEEYRLKIKDEDFRKALADTMEKNTLLVRENEELRSMANSNQNMVETLKAALASHEKQKAQEMEKLAYKLLGEAGDRSQKGDSAFQAFKIEVAGEIQKLDQEIRRQQQILELKNEEIVRLKEENRNWEKRYQTKKVVTETTEAKVDQGRQLELIRNSLKMQYEGKIVILHQQLEKLSSLEKRNQELQQLLVQKDGFLRDLQFKVKIQEDQILRLTELTAKNNSGVKVEVN